MDRVDKVSTKNSNGGAAVYLKLPYARILIPAEEGGFTAEILEFPGCFAEGETADEAVGNLESAAESWIEAALEQGQEIPPPSANEAHSGRIALRLPRDLHRLASRKAALDGASLNQCLVTAIAAWVGADNLFERIAHKIEVNFIQAHFYPVVVTGVVPSSNAGLFGPNNLFMVPGGGQGAINLMNTVDKGPSLTPKISSPVPAAGEQEARVWQK